MSNSKHAQRIELQRAEVHKAMLQWRAAEEFLNFADDPELVDYAIYDLEAARRRYTYLLGVLKRELQEEEALS